MSSPATPAASASAAASAISAGTLRTHSRAVAAGVAGLLISYHADWPTSPTIVLALGAAYLVSLVVGRYGAWRGGQHGRRRHLRA